MQPGRFAYIDALRGYAILMVIAVHTSQAFVDLPSPVHALLSQGARGVQLFFVTSALTLSMSWARRDESATDFYIRRFFRIAPLFWLAIPFFVWLNGTGPSLFAPDGVSLRQIAMVATFVHGFWLDTMSSVVPGGWSVADEVIFYALFPAIVPGLLRVSWTSLVKIAIATIILGAQLSHLVGSFSDLLPPPAQELAGVFFDLWWFPRELPCFIFGIMLFRFSAEQRSFTEATARRVCLLAIALMLVIPFLIGVKYALPLGLPTTYGICFVLFAFSLMHWPGSFLINPAVRWAGTVSYSAYFVHFAVLKLFPAIHWSAISPADFAIMLTAVTLVTIGISSLTYLLIEKPMIRFGNAVISARDLSIAKEAQA